VSTWGRVFSFSHPPPWKEKYLAVYLITGSLLMSTHGSIPVSGIGAFT
jgi:hypothetical protein